MGLLDGYFDSQQAGDGGGLLGRLLALQRQQGQYLPDASSDPSPSASNLTSQYRALQPALSDVAPNPVRPGSQYAQALGLCATGPVGCAVGSGITAGQAILGGTAGLLGGATILKNQNKLPIPGNRPTSTPTGDRRSDSSIVPQIDQAGEADALIERDDRNDLCFNRWYGEHGRCMRFAMPQPTGYRYVNACKNRATDRMRLCHRHGGTPDPEEPAEFSWYDIPRDPARR